MMMMIDTRGCRVGRRVWTVPPGGETTESYIMYVGTNLDLL